MAENKAKTTPYELRSRHIRRRCPVTRKTQGTDDHASSLGLSKHFVLFSSFVCLYSIVELYRSTTFQADHKQFLSWNDQDQSGSLTSDDPTTFDVSQKTHLWMLPQSIALKFVAVDKLCGHVRNRSQGSRLVITGVKHFRGERHGRSSRD